MKLLQQSYVKYGLIMTASLVVCLGLMEMTGNNQSFENKSSIFFVYQFILPALVWYLGLREKKRIQKGQLTFKRKAETFQ